MPSSLPPKLIAVVGPTASGKSAWAVRLAHEFNGVVISADSRQVYKDLDIATAKITKSEMEGVPHYLLDVVRPADDFDVATYQSLVYKLLNKLGATKLPIMAGGTGLYVQAVTDGYVFSTAKPDPKLRARLNRQPLARLVRRLKNLAPDLKIDFNNPRRVIRALEIILQRGSQPTQQAPSFRVLKIGIKLTAEQQDRRIAQRVRRMDFDALARETKKLLRAKFDFSSNPLTALYYKFAKDWLESKITKTELIDKLIRADKQYARRQMTWFKKDRTIRWVTTYADARQLVKQFLADEAE